MPKSEKEKVYLSIDEVHNDERFGWSRDTLYRMKAAGLIKAYKFFGDRKTYWLEEELKEARNIPQERTQNTPKRFMWEVIPGNPSHIPAGWKLDTRAGTATMTKISNSPERYEVSLRDQKVVISDWEQADSWVIATSNKLALEDSVTPPPAEQLKPAS